MRVAIVGFGPKGLYALERLLDHAARVRPRASLLVDLFEPHPSPAAGPNYDPRQPGYLRMNFAAGLVDMWWPSSGVVPRVERRSFVEWSSSIGEPVDPAEYPPRALVGRYLCDGFETLLRYMPPTVQVRLHATSVERVSSTGSGWCVIAGGERVEVFDEVLVATGHVEGSSYPVERIPRGAVVAVRGFGLTFVDVALALTEGRGGSFAPLDHPFRLRYTSSADRVAVIRPFSRTGRPLLAKPDPAVAWSVGGLPSIVEHGISELIRLEGELELVRDIVPVLERVVTATLSAAGVTRRVDAGEWLADAVAGDRTRSTLAPYDELERSLAVGAGLAPPDLPWALGQSWRSLYPAVVATLGGDRLVEDDWPAFLRLAAELERVAFGPAPINAAKLLALVDAGELDFAHTAAGEPQADVLVDAVLPAPGVSADGDSVPSRLVADGYARSNRFRRGIDVDADGSCRAPDGAIVAGLAAIGRPTEDAVIGNDTLNRTLHPHADRWARRVIDRCRLASVA